MNTLFHFRLCQSCRRLRSISLGGTHIPFLGLIERSYHGWLSMMTSSEGPSTRSPPLVKSKYWRPWKYELTSHAYCIHLERKKPNPTWSETVRKMKIFRLQAVSATKTTMFPEAVPLCSKIVRCLRKCDFTSAAILTK